MDTEFYQSILQANIEAADATEFYRQQTIAAEQAGDSIKAELNHQKFVASANLSNMYHRLLELIALGYTKEQAVELADYYNVVNEFRAKQRNWLTMVSAEAIEILTAPIGA